MKSPAFQFYPTDYLGSQRVQMMTLEEEGAYVRLLSSCWQHGSVPADPEQAARLIGKGASTTLAATVLTMFQPSSEPGRMVHDRLEAERVKQAQWREKSAAGGRKSAEMRKGGSTVVKPPYQPKGNTPSPFPIPSPIPISDSVQIPPLPPKGEMAMAVDEKNPLGKSAIQLRAEAIFRKRPQTPMDRSEQTAWKHAKKIVEATAEAEWLLLERYYGAVDTKTAPLYRRRNLATLLNNWAGEISCAREWASKQSEFVNAF